MLYHDFTVGSKGYGDYQQEGRRSTVEELHLISVTASKAAFHLTYSLLCLMLVRKKAVTVH